MTLLREKFGLCCKLLLSCDKCDQSGHFYTRKQLPNRTGRKPFDINLRTVAAFREIGKGHSDIESVCDFMNLCSPMNINAYKKTEAVLYHKYKKVVQENMIDVTRELRQTKLMENFSEGQAVAIDASFDGTWQKRGYHP